MMTNVVDLIESSISYVKNGPVVKVILTAHDVTELTLNLARSIDAELQTGDSIQLDNEEPIELRNGLFAVTTEYSGHWFTKPKMVTETVTHTAI